MSLFRTLVWTKEITGSGTKNKTKHAEMNDPVFSCIWLMASLNSGQICNYQKSARAPTSR